MISGAMIETNRQIDGLGKCMLRPGQGNDDQKEDESRIILAAKCDFATRWPLPLVPPRSLILDYTSLPLTSALQDHRLPLLLSIYDIGLSLPQ